MQSEWDETDYRLTADVLTDDSDFETSYPIIFLAKNMAGYKNLLKISSAILTKAKKGIPLKWLKHYRQGLFAISPGMEGEIEQLLLEGRWEQAKERAGFYNRFFEENSFYLSIQNFPFQESRHLLADVIKLAKEMDIPIVATNKICFSKKEDYHVLKCLEAIKENAKVDEMEDDPLQKEFYFKSKIEMKKIFRDFPEALENTGKIAEQCTVDITFHRQLLPKYPLTNQKSEDFLTSLCEEGLRKKGLAGRPEYEKRLRYELDIIINMKFSDYFLIVWDFVRYAKSKGITVGPGRGSAAGSLVAYCLDITEVDPIQFDLLFERFLNPERVSMPDIDIDFPDHRRDELIRYVSRKYGKDRVAQIITFGTFAARAAVRDVGRVYGLSNKELEQLSKSIPNKLGITLKESYQQSAQLRKLLEHEKYREIFSIAAKIEGLPRHTSTHAAGVIISDRPLVEEIPFKKERMTFY